MTGNTGVALQQQYTVLVLLSQLWFCSPPQVPLQKKKNETYYTTTSNTIKSVGVFNFFFCLGSSEGIPKKKKKNMSYQLLVVVTSVPVRLIDRPRRSPRLGYHPLLAP